MQDHTTEQELKERLSLIERMIAEGRRKTESWGWAFVLWGIVYFVAIAWSALDQNVWAWPTAVSIGVIITIVVASFKAGDHPKTTLARAIVSIWVAVGISMFLLFLTLSLTGRLTDQHLFAAVISAMLGIANGASALILRWKIQLVSAIVWWVAAVGTCFGTNAQSMTVFLLAIFFCQIVFGIYGMIAKAQPQEQRSPGNA